MSRSFDNINANLYRLTQRLEDQHAENKYEIRKIARSVVVIDACALALTIMGLFAWVAYLAHVLGWA